MQSILELIKNEFSNKAIDISECLQLLSETISSTMDDISNLIRKSFEKRDFEKGKTMMKLGEDVAIYQKKIEEIIEILDVEGKESVLEDSYIDELENSIKDKINYEEYKTDSKIEHTLYENLTHIRPYGFRFLGKEIIKVKTWKEMLIIFCEILIEQDDAKFLSFIDNPKMHGKKRKNFSKDEEGMTHAIPVSNDIFVETNFSSNGIRNLILKILTEYKIDPKEFIIYFHADYNELNK